MLLRNNLKLVVFVLVAIWRFKNDFSCEPVRFL